MIFSSAVRSVCKRIEIKKPFQFYGNAIISNRQCNKWSWGKKRTTEQTCRMWSRQKCHIRCLRISAYKVYWSEIIVVCVRGFFGFFRVQFSFLPLFYKFIGLDSVKWQSHFECIRKRYAWDLETSSEQI